tara:strand:+ start:560 stop:694 length:135 start_codon:yes stop_codon:yes gene_type:complete
MPKGGVGRKRNMGDLRALLNWAVLEKKYFFKSVYNIKKFFILFR